MRKLAGAGMVCVCLLQGAAAAERQMEALGRGLVAVREKDAVVLSWRLLASDSPETAFHVYRKEAGKSLLRITQEPLRNSTFFKDAGSSQTKGELGYEIRKAISGREETVAQINVSLSGEAVPYHSIPLQTPAGYTPNDGSVGDLDGDGEYEIVLHQAGRGRDNSQAGITTEPMLEAYKLNGTFLWRINLGRNIREGAHYTQFMVYDLDGDGKAEVACKTADGTTDGTGKVLGDGSRDYRNSRGFILEGSEHLTIFEGATGRALATAEYVPPRGDVSKWGDSNGNRVDRFLACIAYLDGQRPSLVMCRGYYTRTVLAAWNWRNQKLTHLWTFDSDDGTPGNEKYRGQGNHNLSVGDVDGDGRDEVVYGSCVIDNDGKGLYSTGLGHGDAMHFTDIDPARPGLEVFKANGDTANPAGLQLREAGTGKQIWGIPSAGSRGVGRAAAFDIDPRHYGLEMWGKGEGVEGLFNARGEKIEERGPRTCNMGVWWDGDLLRELLNGATVTKWDFAGATEIPLFRGAEFNSAANNGSKANPVLCADIYGDWREEIVLRSADNKELRIFTTTIPTEHRFRTLMQDPIYRLGIAWQNVAYNQSAHPSIYLGAPEPEKPVKKERPGN